MNDRKSSSARMNDMGWSRATNGIEENEARFWGTIPATKAQLDFLSDRYRDYLRDLSDDDLAIVGRRAARILPALHAGAVGSEIVPDHLRPFVVETTAIDTPRGELRTWPVNFWREGWLEIAAELVREEIGRRQPTGHPYEFHRMSAV